MPFFSRKKDKSRKVAPLVAQDTTIPRPKWEDSWARTRVDPEEVAELLHGCTQEVKSRALDVPFILLPFRPSSDPSASRTFIRNYFFPPNDRPRLRAGDLMRELRMTEIMVLVSVLKWCWARLPGGVVTWEAYQAFRVGEKDSQFARDAFHTFVPISVESNARVQIINDFFDLLASLAAHGKTNGLGGHKLSRYAGWWAFEHYDVGKGFDTGYKSWNSAAAASSHMFFAYLRSLSPEPGRSNGILSLPRSLGQLLEATEYPPRSSLLSVETTKVVMIVDVVSPTPYALLRRTKDFEYRDDDRALRYFAAYEDPVHALTEECRRVLRAISTTNQSQVSDAKTSTSLLDPSWSRFEDIGFSSSFDEVNDEENTTSISRGYGPSQYSLSTVANSPVLNLNRPTTPSWADFLSSGFADENGKKVPSAVLMPPDKALPRMGPLSRGQSSQSHRHDLDDSPYLEPGELASIAKIELDESFWWVWISSLAGEEPTSRKAVFGRCAVVETSIMGGQWLVMEEQVKGAVPESLEGAYVVEKKGFLSFTKRGRLTRRRSAVKKSPPIPETKASLEPNNKNTLAPAQQARIQEAAAELMRKKKAEQAAADESERGRTMESKVASRTNSVFTLGPVLKNEASPALQWARQYDKNTIRAQYLGNNLTGKGANELLTLPTNGINSKASSSTLSVNKDLPASPKLESLSQQSFAATMNIESPVEPVSIAEALPPMVEAQPVIVPQPVVSPTVNGAGVAAHKAADIKDASKPPTYQRPTSRLSNRSYEPTHKMKNGMDVPPRASSNKPNGIKRLFSTVRRNKDIAVIPAQESPTDPDPAVAAARRALEGKPPKPTDASLSPPMSPNHFSKLAAIEAPAVQDPAVEPVSAMTTPADELNIHHQTTLPPADHVVEPVRQPTHELAADPVRKAIAVPVHETVAEPVREGAVKPIVGEVDPLPPRTRRDEEFDNLSRVDTREKEQADKEFSRFDQGPLADQPEFAPTESLSRQHSIAHSEEKSDSHFVPPHRPQHQSVYSAVTMQTNGSDESNEVEPVLSLNPQDRWAQIRRNAAERAAMLAEENSRSKTETRTTDEGETSGEETIEARVARIKARVAELTGNMDNTRR